MRARVLTRYCRTCEVAHRYSWSFHLLIRSHFDFTLLTPELDLVRFDRNENAAVDWIILSFDRGLSRHRLPLFKKTFGDRQLHHPALANVTVRVNTTPRGLILF
jgi:hypothetical protein